MKRIVLVVALLFGVAWAQQPPKARICDASGKCAGVTAGALDVNATVNATATTVATATAAPASCTEGQTDCPLSVDLSRNLRISGTINASSTATATAAAPTYGEGTSQPFSQDLAGWLRTRSLHTTAGSPLACRLSDGASFLSSLAVTGTFWQATQPISAASLPLPTGASTESTLSTLNGKVPAQGQALMAASVPVAIASNQSAVPVSGTFWQATQPVSGTVAATQSGTWSVRAQDGAGNALASSTTTPGGTEQALVVRNIPSGTQAVSGTFWQATQPVSGTVTVTDGAGALNVIVDSGTTAATQSGTWTVQPGNTANTTAWLVAGGAADNAAAASTNLATLPAIVETSSTPITRTDGNRAALIEDSDGKVYVRTHDWDPLSASSGLSTATTLTELIAAPGASVSIYITSWKCSSSAASTATTDQQCTIKRGTGTNCGTGTTYVDGCFQTANGGCASSFDGGPLKITANNALCWIHAATGSKIVTVNYFLAP